MLLRGYLILLCAVICCSALPAPKTGIAIYDFSASGSWTAARVTNLREVSSPVYVAQPNGELRKHRYAMEKTSLKADIEYRLDDEGWRENTLYQKLQAFALKEMLKRGYISKTLFDDVSYALGIWKPSQIRFAFDWIELSVAEAKVMYGGKIPWDRVIGGPDRDFLTGEETWAEAPEWWIARWPFNEPLRIVRASIMVGLGQERDLRTGEIHSRPLSWEIYPKAHPLAFGDARKARENIPMMAEFSRALAPDGISGGSLVEPIRVMLSLLEAEARLGGAKPSEYLLFAHALDKAHARYFQQAFKMKPYTEAVRADVLAHRFNYETIPGGRAGEERSVTVTTLSEVAQKVVSTALVSEWSESRHQLCGGVVGRPWEFQRAFAQGMWSHLQFPELISPVPVCITDFSPVFMIPAFEHFVKWRLTSDGATTLMRATNHVKWDPNFLAPYWHGSTFIFFPESLPVFGTQPVGHVRIDNLHPEAVHRFPDYLKNVLLRVYEYQRERIASASPDARRTFFTYVATNHEHLPVAVRPTVHANSTVDEVLDQVLYLVTTADVSVRDKLVALGGKTKESRAFQIPKIVLRDGVPVVIEPIETTAYFVGFSGKQIRGMTEGTKKIPALCSTYLLDHILLQAAAHL